MKEIIKKYNIIVESMEKLNDTSKSEDDIRLQYLVNNKYVLKMNTAGIISEDFLSSIGKLIERYNAIGVWAPKLLKTSNGNYIERFVKDEKVYYCYIEEYAPYKTAESACENYSIQKQMMKYMGIFASKYTGIELMDTPSMWTVIDLHPMDDGIDEKQDNLNELMNVLKEHNYEKEAELLSKTNTKVRNELKEIYKSLPRCVYQGDLNFTNVLVDDKGDFKGLIDFNMAGTEVNINNFLNETAYHMDEQDFIELSTKEIYEKMNIKQKELLDIIFENYKMNDEEMACFPLYKKIIDMSLYPNVMLWIHLIKNKEQVEKVLKLIELICNK